MSDYDELQREQERQDDIEHGVDPMLAFSVSAVDEGSMPEQDLWLCLSGMFMTGRLVTSKDGLYAFMGEREEFRPQENDNSERRTRPRHVYLKNAMILKADGNIIHCPAIRIKLSHVSAWGFGSADFTQAR